MMHVGFCPGIASLLKKLGGKRSVQVLYLSISIAMEEFGRVLLRLLEVRPLVP